MKIGIIGLPSVGKTTVLNAVSGSVNEVRAYSSKQESDANYACVAVPDLRQDWLAELYKPKKNTHATIELVDVAGMHPGQAKNDELSPKLLTSLRQVDALIHVLRSFPDEAITHVFDTVDALQDAKTLELELILADLAVVEKRLGKLDQEIQRKKGVERSRFEQEKELLQRFLALLENEKPLRDLSLTDDEEKIIKGYTFLSKKPIMLVENIGEDALSQPNSQGSQLHVWAKEMKMPLISFCGKVEMEIAQLDAKEQGEFMEALGITESSRQKLIRAAYQLLDLIAFFTVGEDEVKSWTISVNTRAQDAAGKVHSDIARGFIRAEVVGYEILKQAGTWNNAKEKGLLKLEGKDYLVNDGDCINFRFAI